MDMYLTADGSRLQIPLLPDRLNVKTGATFTSFETIKGNQYKIPRGKTVTGYSWSGVFPGEGMALLSFVNNWQEPNRIVSTIERWMEDATILKFMLTETSINADVFIETFTYEYFGAGNISYNITLSAYKKLTISTAAPQPEVTIPREADDSAITISDTKKPSDSAGKSDKDKNSKNNKNNGTDTEKTKLTFTLPQSGIVNAFQNAFNAATSIVSTYFDNQKKESTSSGKQAKVEVRRGQDTYIKG